MKILLCFGIRPDAIKMGSLVHDTQKEKRLDIKVCYGTANGTLWNFRFPIHLWSHIF
jgi:UDP-N-acetylglucosamine 2-epimerase